MNKTEFLALQNKIKLILSNIKIILNKDDIKKSDRANDILISISDKILQITEKIDSADAESYIDISNGIIKILNKLLDEFNLIFEKAVNGNVNLSNGIAFENVLTRLVDILSRLSLVYNEIIETISFQRSEKRNRDIDELLNGQKIKMYENEKETERIKEQFRIQQQIFELEREQFKHALEAEMNNSKYEADKIVEIKNHLESQINELKDRYKYDTANFEIIKQSEIFHGTAWRNREERMKWIIAIIIVVVVLLVLTIIFINSCWVDFSCICNGKSCLGNDEIYTLFIYELVKRASLRFFILFIILFVLKFLIKNYNALMHNITVNEHKSNCFTAASKLISSIENETGRDNILNLAGKAIFEQHKTGYLTKDDSNIDLGLLEKMYSIFGKK
jgi:hypothetical protein